MGNQGILLWPLGLKMHYSLAINHLRRLSKYILYSVLVTHLASLTCEVAVYEQHFSSYMLYYCIILVFGRMYI